MSLTESSTDRKSTVNTDVKVSSETSLSRNAYKDGMSRGTRNIYLASDTEAGNTNKGKTSEHQFGFSATNAANKRPSRKRRLEADSEREVYEKGDDEHADFKRFRAVLKHGEFKWDLPGNLAKYTNDHSNKFVPEKDLQESILVENTVPLNLHPPRRMDEFMRDLIFDQAATKITRCYGTFIQGLDHS